MFFFKRETLHKQFLSCSGRQAKNSNCNVVVRIISVDFEFHSRWSCQTIFLDRLNFSSQFFTNFSGRRRRGKVLQTFPRPSTRMIWIMMPVISSISLAKFPSKYRQCESGVSQTCKHSQQSLNRRISILSSLKTQSILCVAPSSADFFCSIKTKTQLKCKVNKAKHYGIHSQQCFNKMCKVIVIDLPLERQ